ncbi:PREDICTED: IQ domain-containing protein D, partial [Acanthisitta chloris]|uniref:IQ domain-containing protein D n=1 Tax=Acanthisitta chloris TaxID=57068 RepID=UPI0004F0FA00
MATGDPAAFQASSQEVKQRALVKGMAMSPLDAMRVSDPHQSKPDSIETERVLTVLDETIAKLEMIRLIPWITVSLKKSAEMLGPEITDSLMEHQKLSEKVQELLSSLEAEETMRAEEQRLKCSARDILRLFLANPLLCEGLKSEVQVKRSPADAFITAFVEFRGFMLERLLTSPIEEEEKVQFMRNISLQVEENTAMITALRADLAAATRAREEEINKKDKVIEDLKASMEDLARDCKANMEQVKMEGHNQQKKDVEASQARCARLQQDIQQLRAQLSALVLEHRASELLLRKRNCRAETEIQNWIQKYDADMAEKQAEYEEIHAAYSQEKAQLALLMDKHALLLQEYSPIDEARRLLREKEEKAAQELAARTRAAICIQAFWRGYLVRSFLRSKRKKDMAKSKKEGKGKWKMEEKGEGKREVKDKSEGKG